MAAKKTKKLSKSDFIRQHPALSTADVIAKGKDAGLKFTGSLVYMVRGPKDRKGTPKKTAAKKPTSASKKTGHTKVSPPRKTATTATSKNAAPKPGGSKADFVRQHVDLSPKEIVAKAKDQGINLGVTYVYNVRGADKASANNSASKTGPTPRKTSATSTTRTESKADFVRANAALTPKEIVAKALAEGTKLTAAYVYAVRAQEAKTFRKEARAKAESVPPKSAPAPRTKASNGSRPSGSVEALLRAAAAELGLGRAIEILQEERARVTAVLGGAQ